jgi:hypothetical protein
MRQSTSGGWDPPSKRTSVPLALRHKRSGGNSGIPVQNQVSGNGATMRTVSAHVRDGCCDRVVLPSATATIRGSGSSPLALRAAITIRAAACRTWGASRRRGLPPCSTCTARPSATATMRGSGISLFALFAAVTTRAAACRTSGASGRRFAGGLARRLVIITPPSQRRSWFDSEYVDFRVRCRPDDDPVGAGNGPRNTTVPTTYMMVPSTHGIKHQRP